MRVVIAGGGRTAVHLASLLLAERHTVRVVEHRVDVLERLHGELPTEVIIEGNALDTEVFEHTGIRAADVFIACAPDDADNLLMCYLVGTQYTTEGRFIRKIALINNPRHAWLFDQKFHVDVALNQAEILAKLVEEQMSLGDMMILLKLQRGQFSLVEETIPDGAAVIGRALKDIAMPANSVITAILRHGEMVIPRGETELEAGDEVLALVDHDAAEALAALFAAGPKGSGA